MDVVNISMRSNNSIIDTEETIPKVLLEEQDSTEDYSEIGHIVKNMPDNTSKDSPTRTQITEETGNSNTEVLDMLEMNKTASYKQHNQMNMDNTRNSNQHQMSDQHTGVQLINQQSRIPNQANPPFMTPMAPPHYSQIPTEQSRKKSWPYSSANVPQ
ncbi:Hypothetical predicted protein [Mytilus galloprovincialis]|uniref:Uncharacterized protein n=1 Tax=Mytilus galloprovincialis TaxID=29158 RepID=A0A8B6CZY6_MYTGA|nr:Hypothetical predicted protein [Mytilus galloprovincialis]